MKKPARIRVFIGPSVGPVDHAASDPRSVYAMLHGYGDGREKQYQRFERRFMKLHPQANDLIKLEAYKARCRLNAAGKLYEYGCETIGPLAMQGILLMISVWITMLIAPMKDF